MPKDHRNRMPEPGISELLDLLTRYENYGQVHDRDGPAACRSREKES